MKGLMVCVAAAAILSSVSFLASGAGAEEEAREREINVLSGTDPVQVSVDDLVRIEATGIAGSRITAKVTGPAKVQKSTVVKLVKGRRPIGAYHVEFLLTPTGPGKVTAAVTTTYPTGDDSQVENYTITFQ